MTTQTKHSLASQALDRAGHAAEARGDGPVPGMHATPGHQASDELLAKAPGVETVEELAFDAVVSARNSATGASAGAAGVRMRLARQVGQESVRPDAAPAADAGGGEAAQDEGHGFVRLERIQEHVDPLEFSYPASMDRIVHDRHPADVIVPLQPPRALDLRVTGAEDAGVIVVALAGTDADGTIASYTLHSLPAHGMLYTDAALTQLAQVGAAYPGGTLYFVPAAGFAGTASFSYTVTDDDGLQDATPATATIEVTPVNDAPQAQDVTASGMEDAAFIPVTLAGTDADGTIASYTLHSLPANGTLYTDPALTQVAVVGVADPGATLYFVPDPGFSGSVGFSYTVTDVQGLSDATAATATVDVIPLDDPSVNDPPVAQDVTASGPEDAASIAVALAGTDVDGTIANYILHSLPANGTLYTDAALTQLAVVGTAYPVATLYFVPAPQFSGSVSFSYTVTDDGGLQDASAAVAGITVTPVNDDFADGDETLVVAEDSGAANGSVLTGTASVDGPVGITSFTLAGDPATYTAGQTAAVAGRGTFTLLGNGNYTFTPAADWNGTFPLVTYVVGDGSGPTDTSTLAITVTPFDDNFTDANETRTVAEDSGASAGNVLLGTASADGPVDVVSFSLAGDPATYTAGQTATVVGQGTLTLLANGNYTFTPATNWNGSFPVVTYTVTDGSGPTDTSILTITVTPADDGFADADEALTVAEDSGPSTGSVLAGTTSVDGPVGVVTFTLAGDPTTYTAGQTATVAGQGTFTLLANGSYTFTPAANWNGLFPVVSYVVTDGSGTNDTSTLSITVTPVNDDFADTNETLTVTEDSGATVGNVLAGTASPDGPVSVVSFTLAGDPASYAAGQTATVAGQGALTLLANGGYTFTPAADWNGVFPLVTYTVTDGSGPADTSTLAITVTPADDDVADADETLTVPEDSGATSGSVLAGTASADGPVNVLGFTVAGDPTTYTAGQTVTVAGQGTFTLLANGDYTFAPATHWNGSFPLVTYTVTDGSGTDDTSTLAITVTPANDDFTDADESLNVLEDSGPSTGSVLAGTASVDGPVSVASFQIDGTTYAAGQAATVVGQGTLTLRADGSYTFTPAANWNGSFPAVSYTVVDGSGPADTSTLAITVTPVNDDFTDGNETLSVAEDSGPASGSVLAGTTSVDGPVSVASFSLAGDPAIYAAGQVASVADQGTLQLNTDGSYTFEPAPNWNGAFPVVTYTVIDGSGADDTSTLSITVTPADDDLADADEMLTVAEDSGASTGNVLAGTASVDGPVNVVSFTLAGDPAMYTAGQTVTVAGLGTLTLLADGGYSFTPAANWNGAFPLVTYTLTDEAGTNDTSTLSITVTPEDDGFTDANETLTVAEDSSASTGNVLTGTASVDGPVSVLGFQVDGATYAAGQTAVVAGQGTLTLLADGDYTFTPTANWNGTFPVVTYTVTDGSGTDDTSTLSITVMPVDDNFTDADEVLTVAEDSGPTDGNVLAGTASVDGPVSVVSFTLAGDPTTYAAGQVATVAGQGTVMLRTDGSYTFTPALDWNGTFPVVSYTITDGSGTDDTSTLAITVTPASDDFTDADETLTVTEDSGATGGNVLTGTSSPDGVVSVASFTLAGDSATYTAGQTVTVPGQGTLTLLGNGDYTFTPAASWNGTFPIVTYVVTDGSGSNDTSTLTIDVTPADDDFTDADETLTVTEDSGATAGNVLVGTASADGPVSVLSFQIDGATYAAGQTATVSDQGTLNLLANGNYTFTPAANWNGTFPVVTYTVTDGVGADDTSTLSITVAPANDDFTDTDETLTVTEDSGTSTGNVLTGTASLDGPVSVLSFQVNGTTYVAGQTATVAGQGTLTLLGNGDYTFTPAADWNGTFPAVTYTITDGSGTDDTSTLAITVTPEGDGFMDADETLTVAEGSAASTGNVLAGTTSVDGPVSIVSFTLAGDPATYAPGQTATVAGQGTLALQADGGYTFTPAADWNGAFPIVTYTVTDGSGAGDTSTLSITVTPEDDGFTDADETLTVTEDSGASSGSVLAGTTSVDGPVSVVSFTLAGDPATYAAGQTATVAGQGTLMLRADGGYTFTPAANWNGTFPVVTYTVTDGSGADGTSTLAITVTPLGDGFADADESLTVVEDSGSTTGNVLAGTTSADGPVSVTSFTLAGDPATYTAGQTVTVAGQGTLTLLGNGDYTFTPAANWSGTFPVVTYAMTDGSGTDDTSTLAITVTPASDDFADADETLTVMEDSGASTGNVLAGTTSVDGSVNVVSFMLAGDPVAYSAGQTVTLVGQGTLTLQANGDYSFTPAPNWSGTFPVVTYVVTDGSGADDTSTLSITVTPGNDDFADADEALTVVEDSGASTGNVLAGTASADGPVSVVSFTLAGDPATYMAGQVATIAGQGTLQLNADGGYAFTPAANWNGSFPIVTYVVTDGSGSNDTSTLTIDVTPVDDDFTDADETLTVAEDSGASAGNVLAGTASVDGPVSVVSFTLAGDSATYTAGQTVTVPGQGTLTLLGNGDYTFTPAANWNGTFPVVAYTVTDGSGTGDTSTLSITITPADDGFTDADETLTVTEDSGASTGNVLIGTVSVDGPVSVVSFTLAGDPAMYTAGQTVTVAGQGTLTLLADGSYAFTSAANWNGAFPVVTYAVTDGSGMDDTSTLTIMVTPEDDGFTDADEALTVSEDSGASAGNVLAGTMSIDGPVSVSTFQVDGATYAAGQTAVVAGQGTLTLLANGDYTFTPAVNWNGAFPIVTYTVTDGSGAVDASTLAITVTPEDDGFADADETLTVAEDSGASTGNVLAGTTSSDGPVSVVSFTLAGDPATYTAGQTVAVPGQGTLTLLANGGYTFTPAANWNGTFPVVTYSVTDGSGADDTSTLSITVTPADDDLADADEMLTVAEDSGANTGNVLAGTSSVDGPVSIVSFQVDATTYMAGQVAAVAGQGTLVLQANGGYSFTPAPDWNGMFPVVTYTVTDGAGTDDTSTLSIAVTPVDDPSLLSADTDTANEDSVVAGNVLANDSDVDDSLQVASYQVAGIPGSHAAGTTVVIGGMGSLTVQANGDYTFTPEPDWNGAVPLVTYTTSTGSSQTLSITVVPVNDAPVAADVAASGAEDAASIAITLVGTDIDGAVASVTLASLPVNGVLYVDPGLTIPAVTGVAYPGSAVTFHFVPAANYSGTATFQYTVTDDAGAQDLTPAQASITVLPVNDAPLAPADAATAIEAGGVANGTGGSNPTGNVLANDSDVEGSVLTVAAVSGASAGNVGGPTAGAYGTLTLNQDGSYTYVLDNNLAAVQALNVGDALTDTFSYTVQDAQGASSTATLHVTVQGANDHPVLDLSALGVQNVVVNGGFNNLSAGAWPGWQTTGNWTDAGSFAYVHNDYIAGYTLTQTGLTGLDSGPGAFGAARITMSLLWNHMSDPTGQPGDQLELKVSVGGVDYAIVRTPDGGGTGPAFVTYLNGATGSLLSVPHHSQGGWIPWTIDLPSSVAASGSLVFTVAAGGDDLRIDNVGAWVYSAGADAGSGYETTYVEDGAPAAVSHSTSNIADADNSTMSSARVVIGNARAGDLLSVGVLPPGITAAYDAGTYTLTLSGTAPAASYLQALRSVYFSTTDASDRSPDRLIQITVNDGQADSNVATTIMHVSVRNDAPDAIDDSRTTQEDTPLTLTPANLLGNDTDADGHALTITSVQGATNGTVALVNGNVVFTPAANFNGVASFTYTVSDARGGTDSATVSVVVVSANDDFADANETLTVAEDSGASAGNVLTGTTSADGPVSVVRFTLAGDPTPYAAGQTVTSGQGTFTLLANGNYTFTPAANWNGSFPVVTYTVTDGSGTDDTSNLSITVTPVNDAPTMTASSASLSEEGLAAGLADSAGTPDSTDAKVASGTLGVWDDSGASVTFAAPPASALTSGGQTVTWTGAGTNLLVGSTASGEVLRISVDNTGAYIATLSRPIDHPSGAGENAYSLTFGVNASDGVLTTASTITLQIEDDAATAPATINQTLLTTPDSPDVNVLIILDKSSSMDESSGVGSLTRMEVARTAINAMLDSYAMNGGVVRVKVVSFGDGATEHGSTWVDIATAKGQILSIQPVAPSGGTTYYDAGIAMAQTAYNSTGKVAGAPTVSYFISDGVPTSGHAIDTEEAGWINFLRTNGIKSLAYGVIDTSFSSDLGSAADVAASLNPVAYDGATGTNTNAIAISSFADMGDQLVANRLGVAHGTLTAIPAVAGQGAPVQGFGADGGYVQSIVLGGSTYTYNPTANTVSVSGTNNGSFNASTRVLTITIAGGADAGDKLLINMATGAYDYELHAAGSTSAALSFNFTLSDRDGDLSAGVANITVAGGVVVNENAAAPLVGNVLDAIVDRQGDALSVQGVVHDGVVFGPGVAVAGVYGSLLVNGDGTYAYTANSAGADTNGLFAGQTGSDNFSVRVVDALGNVTVRDFTVQVNGVQESGNTVAGATTGGNTLNGTASRDFIDGLAGNDTINGGSGADLVRGGSGNDRLTGGLDADTFQWFFSDRGTTGTPASDTITDFNTASRASGGDVLDFRDLLSGEFHAGFDTGNLTNYLHFTYGGGNTIIYVSTTGTFASGFSTSKDDQNIVLEGVNLVGSFSDDAQIIQDLLQRGKLIVDSGA
jgi:VCBS repeat-containing protein